MMVVPAAEIGTAAEASWKRPQGWRGTTENKTSDKEREGCRDIRLTAQLLTAPHSFSNGGRGKHEERN